jgi:hypothetical protein
VSVLRRLPAAAVLSVTLALALTGCGGKDAVRPATVSKQSQLPAVRHFAAGNFHPDATRISSCKPSQFTCYEQAFGNIAFKQGSQPAAALVGTMLARNDAVVRADCHTIMHAVGSATLARYGGDAARAMAHGSMLCGSGFYHGIVMFALRATRTPAQLVAKVRGMCTDPAVLNTTFLRYQCVHGLGHGLMIFSGDNLPWSLRMCDKLADHWSQQSCSGGVFMQNFNLPSRMSPFASTYVSKKHLLYPCDWSGVQSRYKYYCYLQVTEHVLYVTDYDWKRTASACASAQSPWSNICFQSFGRDVAGNTRYRPAAAYRRCKLTGSYLADCVYGVARDFVNNDVNGRRASRFCELVSFRLRGYCYYAIGTILGTFESPAQTDQTCRSLTPEFVRQCVGYLGSRDRKFLVTIPS